MISIVHAQSHPAENKRVGQFSMCVKTVSSHFHMVWTGLAEPPGSLPTSMCPAYISQGLCMIPDLRVFAEQKVPSSPPSDLQLPFPYRNLKLLYTNPPKTKWCYQMALSEKQMGCVSKQCSSFQVESKTFWSVTAFRSRASSKASLTKAHLYKTSVVFH